MSWKLQRIGKAKVAVKNPVLIVGLPGIGNVGKIAADFIIDEINAKPIYDVVSHDMPNSVFVNDKNLIELPSVELYAAVRKGKADVLVLTGDVQPAGEASSYDLCEKILDVSAKYGVKQVITMGGIGLAEVPKKPSVYCTGNSKKAIKDFVNGTNMNEKLYGLVGPIIGVSGLMVGLAGKRKIPAVCMLAETLGYPTYLGIQGARELVKILNLKYKLGIKMTDLDKEIEDIESEMLVRTQELSKVSKNIQKLQMGKETSYIG
ncbi:PAC2 family protein [Candidatus Woesearchaeota archaeon]|nr:PAC2 family protein [Candidatus Woesearchaeota archaeon]